MDLLTDNPWRIAILTPIKSDLEIDEDPVWIELDGDMVKLGSLEHETLNIAKIQQKALTLLSTKSKDLRILAHFLRTLQHSGKATELLLGLALFADYVETYWKSAPPKQALKKIRLGQQILKRFDNMASNFNKHASRLEKDEAGVQLERLKHCLSDTNLSEDIDVLHKRYTYIENSGQTDTTEDSVLKASQSELSDRDISADISTNRQMIVEPIDIDLSNDRAWRNTLLKVADYLIEKDYTEKVGYVLRRYAVWGNITSAPPSENNRTQLAAISADRVAEYQAAMENASIEIWKEVEYSLTLAPFWFEGHYLSAEIANRLGCYRVSDAIKESLKDFLARLPILKELTFSDNSLFFSEHCRHWLEQTNMNQSTLSADTMGQSVEICYQDKGLAEALQLINSQEYSDMREKSYAQLQSIELLEKANLHNLAKQQYFMLQKSLESVLVKDWEPSLFSLLIKKQERSS